MRNKAQGIGDIVFPGEGIVPSDQAGVGLLTKDFPCEDFDLLLASLVIQAGHAEKSVHLLGRHQAYAIDETFVQDGLDGQDALRRLPLDQDDVRSFQFVLEGPCEDVIETIDLVHAASPGPLARSAAFPAVHGTVAPLQVQVEFINRGHILDLKGHIVDLAEAYREIPYANVKGCHKGHSSCVYSRSFKCRSITEQKSPL